MKYSDTNEHLNDDQLENVNKNNEAPDQAAKKQNEEKPSFGPDPDATRDSSDNPEQDSESLNVEKKDTDTDKGQSAEKTESPDSDKDLSIEKTSSHDTDKDLSVERASSQGPDKDPSVKKTSSQGPAEKISSQDPDKDLIGEKASSQGSDKDLTEEKTSTQEKVEVLSGEKALSQDPVEEKTEEKINYELLSKPDLVKVLEDLLNKKTFETIRSSVDEIQEVFTRKQEEELKEKRERFMAEGGLEQDFKPAEDPVDRHMGELMERYRTLKADFSRQMEDLKEANLAAKQEILEEFRLLMEKPEGFDHTFRKFKQLQKRWFDIGIVPRQNVRDLWNSYNFFVDKFNDFVNISKELKELDLKKNLEKKTELCVKAEALAGEPNISQAFKTLQTFHSQWRGIGPVPREDKDPIWERFRAATSVINRAHQDYQSELKDNLIENLEIKRGLCEKAEELAALELTTHREWVDKTRELLKLQKEWKSVGYAPKKDNNRIYAQFRKACDLFFKMKAGFYAESLEQQKEIIRHKKEIVATAEALKDSKDWKQTTEKLIELQKQWKEAGPLPKRESDKLWNRFRSACDYFFEKKSEFFGGDSESYGHNLKAKEALIKEINETDPPGDAKELLALAKEFQQRYDEIGFVPVEDKDRIRDDFRDALNSLVERLDAKEQTKALVHYRMKIAAIVSGPRSNNKLRFERDKVMNKLQQLKNDIGVWENNIGFFKQTESSEGTITDFQEKIDDAHERIALLENKIRIIDEYDET
jgi:hypothetical protein